MEKIRFAQSYVKLWDKINLKLWTKIESNQIFLVTNNGLFSNFFYRYNRSANCTEKIAVVINAILNIKKYYFFVGDYGKETRKIFTLHLVCNNNIHNISMYQFFSNIYSFTSYIEFTTQNTSYCIQFSIFLWNTVKLNVNDTSDIGSFQLASHIQKQVVSHNKIHSKKN